MIVLALDLASRASGWAIFDTEDAAQPLATGLIKPKPLRLTASERLPVIVAELKEVIDKWNPRFAILETPAGGAEDKGKGPTNNWLTMSVLFLTHGAVQYTLHKRKIPFELISPSTWQNRLGFFKRDRQGRKAAAKEYVLKTYPTIGSDEEQDIYDAICLYDCWVYLCLYRDKEEEEEISAF